MSRPFALVFGFSLLFSARAFPAVTISGARLFCANLLGAQSWLHYRITEPASPQAVRVQYIHLIGFGDTPKNSEDLFFDLTSRGVRSISIEYPSHGQATGAPLGFFTLPSLAERVLLPFLKDVVTPGVPYVIGGWSTGGTITEYLVQSGLLEKTLGRQPAGVIEIAPGLPVKLLPGCLGFVTKDTLSSDPVLTGVDEMTIRPRSPFFHPLFAASLAWQSFRLRNVSEQRAAIPTLVFIAGENQDHYADSKGVAQWARALEALPNSRVRVVRFPYSYHALQWEPQAAGRIRELIKNFVGLSSR